MSKLEELLELAATQSRVDIGRHIYAHNQMLRQLIDAAELSTLDPRMPVFKPRYEIEVDFK